MRINSKFKLNRNRCIVASIFICVIFMFFKHLFNTEDDLRIELISESLVNDDKNVKVFDLTQEPQDTFEYKSILCRKSKQIFEVVTTLCVHDLAQDKYVSSSIWTNVVWEEGAVTEVLRLLKENPEWLFLGLC